MPVCPFCQTDLAMPNLPCPSCGKRMTDHPSLAEGKSYSVKPAVRTSGSMAAVRQGGAPQALGEVPELELSSRHVAKPKPAPSARWADTPQTPGADVPATRGDSSALKAPSLPPAAPKKPAPARIPGQTKGPAGSRPASGSALSNPGVGGAAFDDDDVFAPDGGNGAALELDMPPGAGMPAFKPPPPPDASLRSSNAPRSPGPSRGDAPSTSSPSASLALPGGGSGQGGMLETHADGAEAAAVADYGDSPESWWQAPLYAYRVKTRQAELRRQLKERQTDLARARQAEEQATVAFADRARHAALKVEAFAQHLEPIATREKLMLERDGALSAEMEAHRARLLVIDDRIAGLSAELAEAKAEERQIEEKLAEAEGIRQRADAKLKRAEIEIRNASSLADAAGAAQRETAKRAGLP